MCVKRKQFRIKSASIINIFLLTPFKYVTQHSIFIFSSHKKATSIFHWFYWFSGVVCETITPVETELCVSGVTIMSVQCIHLKKENVHSKQLNRCGNDIENLRNKICESRKMSHPDHSAHWSFTFNLLTSDYYGVYDNYSPAIPPNLTIFSKLDLHNASEQNAFYKMKIDFYFNVSLIIR